MYTRRTHLGIPGLCFECNGDGVVEGDAMTILTAKKAQRERLSNYLAFYRACRSYDKVNLAGFGQATATRAMQILEDREPERFEKEMRSFLQGREDLFPALVNWLAQQ